MNRIMQYDHATLKNASLKARKNPKAISYEVFFQNPSGISEDLAERSEEDDLLQNQNKSNTVIEDDNDQTNLIDELNKNINEEER